MISDENEPPKNWNKIIKISQTRELCDHKRRKTKIKQHHSDSGICCDDEHEINTHKLLYSQQLRAIFVLCVLCYSSSSALPILKGRHRRLSTFFSSSRVTVATTARCYSSSSSCFVFIIIIVFHIFFRSFFCLLCSFDGYYCRVWSCDIADSLRLPVFLNSFFFCFLSFFRVHLIVKSLRIKSFLIYWEKQW